MNKQLWAPWRQEIIYQRRHKRCIFCVKPKEKKDPQNYIFMRRRHSFAILNLYPYNNGHVMVVPHRHVGTLEALTPRELLALMLHVRDCQKTLRKILKPHGFNIGVNEGRVGGAGFKNHVHLHIVPRWSGDTNFMPVLSDTKVISESLAILYRKLTHAQSR